MTCEIAIDREIGSDNESESEEVVGQSQSTPCEPHWTHVSTPRVREEELGIMGGSQSSRATLSKFHCASSPGGFDCRDWRSSSKVVPPWAGQDETRRRRALTLFLLLPRLLLFRQARGGLFRPAGFGAPGSEQTRRALTDATRRLPERLCQRTFSHQLAALSFSGSADEEFEVCKTGRNWDAFLA